MTDQTSTGADGAADATTGVIADATTDVIADTAADMTADGAAANGAVAASLADAPRKRQRRMAREPRAADAEVPSDTAPPQAKTAGAAQAARGPSKLDMLTDLLRREGGATLAELQAASGWQAHSVRGAIAGALKQRGMVVISEKIEGVRRYRAEGAA